MNNIVLIGMPGAGKSTIGILLAKTLGKEFIDTDLVLQKSTNALLRDIIDEKGISTFIEVEKEAITSINCSNTVIATGGSVVLNPDTIAHLQAMGIIVYLKLDIDVLVGRINNIETRGIVKGKDQTLNDIYRIRTPLYEKYSNIIIDCNNRNHEQVLKEIIAGVRRH